MQLVPLTILPLTTQNSITEPWEHFASSKCGKREQKIDGKFVGFSGRKALLVIRAILGGQCQY